MLSALNVMGAANRAPALQMAAQSAAQNVMRRNRLKALIGKGAAGVPTSGQTSLLRSTMNAHPTAHTMPLIGPGGLTPAQQKALAAMGAQLPSGLNPGGSGADFGSIGDTTDPSQSRPSIQPGTPGALAPPQPGGAASQAPYPVPGPVQQPSPGTGLSGGSPVGNAGGVVGPSPFADPSGAGTGVLGAAGNAISSLGNGGGLIPLGGGLFFDPATDTVTGGSGAGGGNGPNRAS